MLKVTKANVCASIAVARLFLANTKGRATTARTSWGRKASASKFDLASPAAARYSKTL